MDKLAKVRAEVERLDNEWYLCNSSEAKYKRETYKEILDFINSLQQEPVNEELEKAAKDYSNNLDNIYGSIGKQKRNAFKAGAQWQKENLWKSADGNDLKDET